MARSGSGGIRQEIALLGDAEVRRAFDDIGRSGARAFDGIDRASRRTSERLDDINRSGADSVRTFGTLRTTFSNFRTSISGVVGAFVPLRAALAALAGLGAAAGARGAIGSVTQSLTDLQNISAGSGVSPAFIVALNDALARTGVVGENVRGMLAQFFGQLGEARLEAQGVTSALENGVAVMRGTAGAAASAAKGVVTMRGALSDAAGPANNLVKVFRGGQAAEDVKSLSEPFKALGLDVRKFTSDVQGNEQSLIAALKALRDLKGQNDALRSAVGSRLLGEDDFIKFAAALDLIADQIDGLLAKARQAGRVPSNDDFNRLREYNAAWADLGNAIQGAIQPAVITLFPLMASAIRGVTTAIQTQVATIKSLFAGDFQSFHQAQMDQLRAGWEAVSGLISEGIKAWLIGATEQMQLLTEQLTEWLRGQFAEIAALGEAIHAAFVSAFQAMAQAALSQIDIVKQALSDVWDLVKRIGEAIRSTITGALSGIAGIIPGFASGGAVHGPGTGTSDSILARLSAGEYVVRAAAVDKLGLPFLDALNGLRTPLIPRTRFAAGGLVTAPAGGGSGAARSGLTLVLDGAAHHVETDEQTYRRIERVARKRAMLSGGTRPGWAS